MFFYERKLLKKARWCRQCDALGSINLNIGYTHTTAAQSRQNISIGHTHCDCNNVQYIKGPISIKLKRFMSKNQSENLRFM